MKGRANSAIRYSKKRDDAGDDDAGDECIEDDDAGDNNTSGSDEDNSSDGFEGSLYNLTGHTGVPNHYPMSLESFENETNSSTGTRPIKRGQDSSFRVDISFTAYYKDEPRRSCKIFDCELVVQNSHVPILIEVKTVPTRKATFESVKKSLNLRSRLVYRLLLAYPNINPKAPAVFHFRERQHSLIGITASGPL